MSVVRDVIPLGFPWQTADPFLFCAHHDDAYPRGNDEMGPDVPLTGRHMGQDFSGRDGWSMYHGTTVPGFPRHPHCGFETVTIVRNGYVDHSDSMGAQARFGNGDVQWITTGRGVEHCEMFPLVHRDRENPTELFQIWLNLPRASKKVEPHFAMLWGEELPRRTFTDDAGRSTEVTVIAGALDGAEPPSPPPGSWASDPNNHVAIWTLRLEPGATWTVPAGPSESNRTLYFFVGDQVRIGDRTITDRSMVRVVPDTPIEVTAGEEPCELLLLQGRPIGEPVVQHGPFVANTPGEIRQAIVDYQRGTFGRWGWESPMPVHPRESGRFAIHADGRREEPDAA